MAYRSRSKFTPGSGVLAFFEQVSRYVSLSVVGWVVVSLFFILFVADGKITDSFDLHLVKGIFSSFRLFWTAMLILAFNGVLGGLIALPSALVLLICRQYLDYESGRISRRGGAWKVKLVRSLPVSVLLTSHALVLFANLISAPQLTRDWFKEDSRFASTLTAAHHVMGSLTRKSYAEIKNETKSENSATKTANKNRQGEARRLHLIMIPADLMENDDFKAEQSKLKDSGRVSFVISGSNIIEQLDSLFVNLKGPLANLLGKTLHAANDYGQIQSKPDAQVLVSISPQLRFGRQPVGLGTDSLATLKDKMMIYEAQRRLLLSQVQNFGVIRLFDGVPFVGQNIDWLELVSDDVARIRLSGMQMSRASKDSNSVAVIQLDSLENRFSSVQSPFRPKGWPLRISNHERRLIIKNIFRELAQYIYDNASSERDFWLMLPYTDEKRTKAVSFAVFKEGSGFMESLLEKNPVGFGVLNDELGTQLAQFLSAAAIVPDAPLAKESKHVAANDSSRMRCFDTEVDPAGSNLQFQSSDLRERSLGELLNSLIQMPESDLHFLSRGALNLIAREPGFGFLCRTENQSINEVYLLKYQSGEMAMIRPVQNGILSSILLSRQHSENESGSKWSSAKLAQYGSPNSNSSDPDDIAIKRDVLSDFVVYQLLPNSVHENELNEPSDWRLMDQRESQMFFAKFEHETLRVLETFARARIR